VVLCFVGLIVHNVCLSSGSKVVFTASPDTVNPCNTKTLSLRCSLVNTASGTVGRREVSETPYDSHLILSVFITKNSKINSTIASISTVTGGQAQTDLNNVSVTGSTSSQNNEKAFLEVTWTDPNSSETGDYSCEINAVDPQGHAVIYEGHTSVSVNIPCSQSLAQKVANLEKEMASLKAQLGGGNHGNQTSVTSHTEQGVVVCGGADSWTQTDQLTLVDYQQTFSGKQVVKTVKFTQRYDQTPKVHLGARTVGAMANLGYISYNVEVTRVDEEGFDVSCSTWADADMYRLNVNWISIP